MPRPFNYRRALLAAVEAFLQRTPESLEKAHRQVRRLRKAREFTTLDTLVWAATISELTDSIFYEEDSYLTELRATLLNGSPEIHRGYFNRDYREDGFTPLQNDWYERLRHLGDFLASFPFADIDAEAAITDYEQQVSAIERLTIQTPAPQHIGQEPLQHFILREVTAALTTIDLRHSLLNVGWLIPNAPYKVFPPAWARRDFDRLPNLKEEVAWANRMLLALAGEGWCTVTWQVLPAQYLVSLH